MSEFPLEEPSSTDTLDRVPATFFLAASWVLVFALMAYAQGRLHINAGNWVAGGIKAAIASQFGSLNTQAVFDGQFHRTLTATFIHFSLLHLIINTVVFYQLGRSIEPWYGSGQFFLLYVLLGVGRSSIACDASEASTIRLRLILIHSLVHIFTIYFSLERFVILYSHSLKVFLVS